MKLRLTPSPLIIVGILASLCVGAKEPLPTRLNFTTDGNAVVKTGDKVSVDISVTVPARYTSTAEMMVLTPVLRATDGTAEIELEHIAIIGRNRTKALERNSNLGYFKWDTEPDRTLLMKSSDLEIPCTYTVAYEPWMRSAELLVMEDVAGCLRTDYIQDVHKLIFPALPPAYKPHYELAHMTPPDGVVKTRNELYVARINFRVNRYEILPDYMNNAEVFKEVDNVISEIKSDPAVSIDRFCITGYASPEGYVDANKKLSENRAKAFVNYIVAKHGIDRNSIDIKWNGEDWNGLAEQMKVVDFPHKDDIAKVLDATTDPAKRKSMLRALGQTYRTVLKDYYPYLRRSEYSIAYTVRPFNLEEAKEIMKTKPQWLSENEFYIVARSYPEGSSEAKQAFDLALKLYPSSIYARVNSAATDIAAGKLDAAMSKLETVDTPEAWNNIGYIYLQKKEYDRAIAYFKKAAEAGYRPAARNIEEFNKWMENPE